MAKPRFVVRYTGDGEPRPEDVARLQGMPDAVVVDSSPNMLLVETDPEPLRDAVAALPDWMMVPEQIYSLPDTRKTIAAPPGDAPTG